MTAPTGDWPLTAAATQVLRDPHAEGRDLLKLTLKELVLRKVWRLEERSVKRGLLGRQVRSFFLPGDRDVPHMGPLPRVDAALRRVCDPAGEDVRDAVKEILGSGGKLTHHTREDARAEAQGLGLIAVEKTRKLGLIPWTTIRRTPAGESWCEESYRREHALDEHLERRPQTASEEATAMAGLVLLMTPATLVALDEAVVRLGGPLATSGVVGDFDFGGAFDGAFDSAVDAGSSDGGGGGDAGGGGDGGG